MVDVMVESTAETIHVEKLSRLFTVVSDHVRSQELAAIRGPQWTMPREEIPGKLGKRLHRLYANEHGEFLCRVVLAFTLLLSLELDSLLPSMYISLGEAGADSIARLLLLLILLSPLLLAPVYSAIGAYWTVFELIRNRHLSRRAKGITLVIIVMLVGIWFLAGSPRIWDLWPSHDVFLDIARANVIYYLIAVVLIYVPALSYVGFLLPRVVTAFAVFSASLFRWAFRFHAVERVDRLREFLSTPLPLLEESKSQALLELGPLHIDALQDWAACRRKVVQDRLVPTTLLLAFFGIMANTFLGDEAARTAREVVRSALRPSMTIEYFNSYSSFLLLMITIIVPVVILAILLSESLVMDYIAQACVLAKHAKKLDEGRSKHKEATTEPRASEPIRPPGCLSGLSGSIVTRILGGKTK